MVPIPPGFLATLRHDPKPQEQTVRTAVTSVVVWLRDYGIDIGVIEVSVRRAPDSGQALIATRQLLPLPEAEDYLVRRLASFGAGHKRPPALTRCG